MRVIVLNRISRTPDSFCLVGGLVSSRTKIARQTSEHVHTKKHIHTRDSVTKQLSKMVVMWMIDY